MDNEMRMMFNAILEEMDRMESGWISGSKGWRAGWSSCSTR